MKTLREYKESVLAVLLEQDRFQNTAKALLGSTPVSTSALLEKLTQPDTTIHNIFELDPDWDNMVIQNDSLTPVLYTLANSHSIAAMIEPINTYLDLHYEQTKTSACEAALTVFGSPEDNRMLTLKNANNEKELASAIQTVLKDPAMQAGWVTSKPQGATELESLLKQLPTSEQSSKQTVCLEGLQKVASKQADKAKTQGILKQHQNLRVTTKETQQKLNNTKALLSQAQNRIRDLQVSRTSLEIAGNAITTETANLKNEFEKLKKQFNTDVANLSSANQDLLAERTALRKEAAALQKRLHSIQANAKAGTHNSSDIIDGLKAEVASLTHQLHVANGYRSQDAEIIKNLKNIIADLQKEINARKEQHLKLYSAHNALEKNLPKYRETIARQEQDYDNLQKQLLELQRQNQTLTALTPPKPAQVVAFKGKPVVVSAPQPVQPSYAAVASNEWPTLEQAASSAKKRR